MSIEETRRTRKRMNEALFPMFTLEESLQAREKMNEAFQTVDWETLVRQILAGSPSSNPAGPANSLVSTVYPRVLPVKPDHDPVAIEGEEAELLKRPENWTAIARERKMQPFLSSDQLTAKATTEISSVPLPRVRQMWLNDVRRILAKKQRGENRE